MMNKPKPRTWYYKILSIAKKQLSMDEDTYRSVLADCGAPLKNNKYSATNMTIPQLEQAVHHMKQCGFKTKPKFTPKQKQIWLIKKLWSDLHHAGVMREPYSEAVVTKFAAKMTGVANINWSTPLGLAKTIEALKNMAKRERVAT